MTATWLRVALFCFLLGVAVSLGVPARAETLALVGGRVYASPDATPLTDAVAVSTDGVITAIGSRSEV